jgi:hypothetical protein
LAALVMPGDPGYAQVLKITQTYPKVGKGLLRVIISMTDLKAAWPTSPLLSVKAPAVLTDI